MKYLIALIAVVAVLPIQLHAEQTWDVYPGQSIQAAIDNADPDDDVVVHSEIFRGYTYYESITLKPGVTVHSVSYEPEVTIHGQSSLRTVSFSGNGQGMHFGGENVGFIIDGSTSQAVWLWNCQNLHVEDLKIISNGLWTGFTCNADTSVQLDNIRITGNNFHGIEVWGDVVLIDCTVENCVQGMRVMSGGATVQSAHIQYCDSGFVAAATSGLVLESSTIKECTKGVKMFNWIGTPSEPATFADLTIEHCETGIDISTYASVTEWAHIDDCEFWYCEDGLHLGNFKGSVTGCDFVEIYDTALKLSESHAVANIGGAGQGNQFELVDGIGIHLASGAQATVEDNEFHHVLGTAIQCETGTDGTTIQDCIMNGSGGCFQGIRTRGTNTMATVRDCIIRDYDSAVIPLPRGVSVTDLFMTGPTANLGTLTDRGYNQFYDNTTDLLYGPMMGHPGQTPVSMYAQYNFWGEDPPASQSFGGSWADYIIYDPWLHQSPEPSPPLVDDPGIPADLVLDAVRPNPVRGNAIMAYGLPSEAEAELCIWDIQGRLVRTLLAGKQPAGRRTVEWNTLDNSGNSTPSGVYLCRLASSEGAITRRLVLTR